MADPAKKNEAPAAAPVPPVQVNVMMPEPKVKVDPEVFGRISQPGGRFGIRRTNKATGERELVYVNAEGQQIA